MSTLQEEGNVGEGGGGESVRELKSHYLSAGISVRVFDSLFAFFLYLFP